MEVPSMNGLSVVIISILLVIILSTIIRMGFFDAISDFAGSVFNTAKTAYDKVGNVARALVSTAEKWAGGEYHAPNFTTGGTYSYCGPGTKISTAGPPVNAVDSACRTHDLEYERFASLKNTLPTNQLNQMIRQSDEKLIRAIDESGQTDWGARLARLGIRAKTKAEDWGLLDPGRFVV